MALQHFSLLLHSALILVQYFLQHLISMLKELDFVMEQLNYFYFILHFLQLQLFLHSQLFMQETHLLKQDLNHFQLDLDEINHRFDLQFQINFSQFSFWALLFFKLQESPFYSLVKVKKQHLFHYATKSAKLTFTWPYPIPSSSNQLHS